MNSTTDWDLDLLDKVQVDAWKKASFEHCQKLIG